MPPILFSKKDFNVVTHYKAKPNYITNKKITGELLFLENINRKKCLYNFHNKFLVIENADPGYDWIFTRKPAGVITKYGGVASHVAIRCAELQIPAAIGCGNTLYTSLEKANKVILDCANKNLIILN